MQYIFTENLENKEESKHYLLSHHIEMLVLY